MIVTDDIWKLFALKDDSPVQVVKNAQRFEWPSLMLFDCEQCDMLTPDYVENEQPQKFEWADSIGDLPAEWNFCVGYDTPGDSIPKLIHYTRGIPYFPECRNEIFADLWHQEAAASGYTVSWLELMGTSVHAEGIMKDLKKLNGSETHYFGAQ